MGIIGHIVFTWKFWVALCSKEPLKIIRLLLLVIRDLKSHPANRKTQWPRRTHQEQPQNPTQKLPYIRLEIFEKEWFLGTPGQVVYTCVQGEKWYETTNTHFPFVPAAAPPLGKQKRNMLEQETQWPWKKIFFFWYQQLKFLPSYWKDTVDFLREGPSSMASSSNQVS